MKHLVFVGPQASGKTTIVGRVACELNRLGFEIQQEFKVPNDSDFYGLPEDGQDFYAVLKRGNEYIICYSWSDVQKYVNWLGDFIRGLLEQGINLVLVVMASRGFPEWMYGHTERVIGLTDGNRVEFPLAKITAINTREESLTFYLDTIFILISQRILPQLLE